MKYFLLKKFLQRRLRPLALGLLVVVLFVLAIRMARSAPPEEKPEGKKVTLESFKPTERIAPEQAVDFPVDI